MTISEILTKIQAALKKTTANQTEMYEGQFEILDEFIIAPPSLFLEVEDGGDSERIDYLSDINITIYTCTSSFISNDQTSTLFDFIDEVKDVLKKEKFKKYRYDGFRKFGNLPGLKVYTIHFKITN